MVNKKKIILLEMQKIFLSIQFLQSEEQEVFTEYGKGLISGILDPDSKRTIQVVAKTEYEKLEKKHKELERLYANCKSLATKLATKKKKAFTWFR